ncbi:hypothetical protein IID24_02440 [Patescibacteria group bacterium]|nr:hypothetical protein [Patescibacteria group bacterium]
MTSVSLPKAITIGILAIFFGVAFMFARNLLVPQDTETGTQQLESIQVVIFDRGGQDLEQVIAEFGGTIISSPPGGDQHQVRFPASSLDKMGIIGSRLEQRGFQIGAFTLPPDPGKIVGDGTGAAFPVNRIVILLALEATWSDAVQIAGLVSGHIVGHTPSANSFVLEVPASTISELTQAIEFLEGLNDPRIDGAMRQHRMNPL